MVYSTDPPIKLTGLTCGKSADRIKQLGQVDPHQNGFTGCRRDLEIKYKNLNYKKNPEEIPIFQRTNYVTYF